MGLVYNVQVLVHRRINIVIIYFCVFVFVYMHLVYVLLRRCFHSPATVENDAVRLVVKTKSFQCVVGVVRVRPARVVYRGTQQSKMIFSIAGGGPRDQGWGIKQRSYVIGIRRRIPSS